MCSAYLSITPTGANRTIQPDPARQAVSLPATGIDSLTFLHVGSPGKVALARELFVLALLNRRLSTGHLTIADFGRISKPHPPKSSSCRRTFHTAYSRSQVVTIPTPSALQLQLDPICQSPRLQGQLSSPRLRVWRRDTDCDFCPQEARLAGMNKRYILSQSGLSNTCYRLLIHVAVDSWGSHPKGL